MSIACSFSVVGARYMNMVNSVNLQQTDSPKLSAETLIVVVLFISLFNLCWKEWRWTCSSRFSLHEYDAKFLISRVTLQNTCHDLGQRPSSKTKLVIWKSCPLTGSCFSSHDWTQQSKVFSCGFESQLQPDISGLHPHKIPDLGQSLDYSGCSQHGICAFPKWSAGTLCKTHVFLFGCSH